MKINAIKKLVEEYDLETIRDLTNRLENGEELYKPVEGYDEGEQLTHLLGAIWVLEQVSENGSDVRTELRNFASRVRESIN